MSKFIVFNTLSQAKNYVKRQHIYDFYEGCGCCSQGGYTAIEGQLVVNHTYGQTTGQGWHIATIVGRIKRGVSASN